MMPVAVWRSPVTARGTPLMTSAIGRTERRAEFFCLRVTHPCLNEKVGCGPERACQMVQNELRPTRTWKAV